MLTSNSQGLQFSKTCENPALRQQESCSDPWEVPCSMRSPWACCLLSPTTLRSEATTAPAAERDADRGELASSLDRVWSWGVLRDWFYVSEKVQAPSRSSWVICTAQYNNLFTDNVRGGRSNAVWVLKRRAGHCFAIKASFPYHFTRYDLNG